MQKLLRRLSYLFRRNRLENELDEELRFHIEMKRRELEADGLDAAEAAKAARRGVGNVPLTRDRVRDVWIWPWLQNAILDLRYSVRALWRRPVYSGSVIGTIALAVALLTTILTISVVLARPLPFEDPDELFRVDVRTPDGARRGLSVLELEEWQRRIRTFAALGGFLSYDFTVVGGQAEALIAYLVTPGYLDLLGAKPARGRPFLPDEYEPGADRVVLLTHTFWVQRYDADPNVIGRTIDLEGSTGLRDSTGRYTVVGILPADFWHFHERGEIVLPLRTTATQMTSWSNRLVDTVIGRLTESTPQQAGTELTDLTRRLEREHLGTDSNLSVSVHSLAESHLAAFRSNVSLLLASTALVMLVAAMNVTLVVLARTHGRGAELAVRSSFGAGRLRLAWVHVSECTILAALGGSAGILTALWATPFMTSLIPPAVMAGTPGGVGAITPDTVVVVLALLSALVVGVCAASAAAWVVLHRQQPERMLNSGGRSTKSTTRVQRTLIAAQVAVAVVLVAGSGLLVRSFLQLQAVDLGVRPKPGIIFWVNLSPTRYMEVEARTRFYDDVLRELVGRPEVTRVSGVSMPFTLDWYFRVYARDDQAVTDPRRLPAVLDRAVTPTYFEEHGTALLAGRTFTEHDRPGRPRVAVLSNGFARQLWPGQRAVGKQLRVGGSVGEDFDLVTVVGVVADVRHASHREPEPMIYRPYAQHSPPWMYVSIEGLADAQRLMEVAREAVWQVDPNTPLEGPWTMEVWIAEQTAESRMLASVVSTFGSVALVLATVGTLGAMLYMVGLRMREFGIRMALGATNRRVIWTAARVGLVPACQGIAVGMVGAVLLGQALRTFLVGVTPVDAWVLGGVALLFAAGAVATSLVPAYWAARADPVTVLRAE